jgi:ParB-like chromosome segregation protein Spo0J
MSEMVPIANIRFDETIYPRERVDPQTVTKMTDALRNGFTLPPITLERDTLRLVDGRHRWLSAMAAGQSEIEAELKTWPSDVELFLESAEVNDIHGLGLSTQDKVRCADIGQRLGVGEDRLAAALRTSVAHLRVISERYATVAEAEQAVAEHRQVEASATPLAELRQVEPSNGPIETMVPAQRRRGRRVHLKNSVRHLAGTTISADQARAMDGAPGQSYLLNVRQLLDALAFDLLPSAEQHPVLWAELRRLHDQLTVALSQA